VAAARGLAVSAPVRIGTQGWNYPAWVGPFYPAGTRPAAFLTTYARAFRTVEVDSTFYAVPAARVVRGWASRVPEDFVFALKLPQEVTHERRLRGALDVVRAFLDAARELGPRLGPVLVQMGPDFDASERASLEAFLPTLPDDVRFAVELRHASWIRPETLPALLGLLSDHRVALAMSDGRWLPRRSVTALAAHPTAPFHYVRWMGPDRAITDYSRLLHDRSAEVAEWAEVLRRSALAGTEVYGYFNNHFAGHSPANARDLLARLDQRVVTPDAMAEQTSLF
jgi:uncharacterized protein YecE (DUF72 family)